MATAAAAALHNALVTSKHCDAAAAVLVAGGVAFGRYVDELLDVKPMRCCLSVVMFWGFVSVL